MSGIGNQMHYSDVAMSVMASQIIEVSIVYLNVCSGAYQRKHQSSVSLAFVRGIHRWPVNSPHKGPGMRKMFAFDDVIMLLQLLKDKGSTPLMPVKVTVCMISSEDTWEPLCGSYWPLYTVCP